MTGLRLGNVSYGSVSATVEVMTERESLDRGCSLDGYHRFKLSVVARTAVRSLSRTGTVQALCRQLGSSLIPAARDFDFNSVA